MFLDVGSGTNESTMSDFSTRIKSLHILGNFSKLRVVEFEDASTSFHGWKSRFGSCVFIHGASTSKKKSCMDSKNSLWHQQDSAIEAHLAMSSASAVRLSPSVQKQKLKLELLRGSRLKLESLLVIVVHEHLVRAGCMFFGTATRRTLTRLHRTRNKWIHVYRIVWVVTRDMRKMCSRAYGSRPNGSIH